jgi:energy-coupling factor transport system permease protein
LRAAKRILSAVVTIIKNLSIGQYFPGNSALHRMDPRSKLALTFVLVGLIIALKSPAEFIFLALFLTIVAKFSKIPFKMIFKGVRSIIFFVFITSVFNVFFTDGAPIFKYKFITITREGVIYAILLLVRVFFLMFATSLMTLTTSPLSLTDGLESAMSPLKKFKFPAHEFAMMITIALRFIPTLFEEIEKIMKAQSSRGADFESKNLIKKARALTAILIPLFLSAFRRADELATAMECRCYQGGEKRTKLKELKFSRVDAIAVLVFAAFLGIMLFLPRAQFFTRLVRA